MVWYSHLFQNFPQFIMIRLVLHDYVHPYRRVTRWLLRITINSLHMLGHLLYHLLQWWLRWRRICLQGRISIPGLGRPPGEVNGNPLQYSCLENPMDRGAWRATVRGVARVGHDLVTKPPPQHPTRYRKILPIMRKINHLESNWNLHRC